MKLIIILLSFIVLSNCTTHTVKLGKKCTKLADDNTYEKSIVWIVSKENIETLRPHIGICASKYFNILDKKIKKNIKSGEPIFQSMIK